MSKVYLSGYHQGDIDGQHRFFDETSSEMLFKFLNSDIQVKFVKELNYIPDPESIIYYSSSAGGHYFFAIKSDKGQCLILTSF
jgi:hypothetical protein